MILDLQVSPARMSWPVLRETALGAEAAGFGAFHVLDHLAGLPLGGSTMIECFALLGALAEATTSIELGSMVVNVWNRQVGTAVVAAASIAELSGRHFHFGIGAGAAPDSTWALEQRAVEADLDPDIDERHRRVVDVIDLARRMWSSGRADDLGTFPLPSPAPSLIVGVNSVRLARLAGRHADGINVQWNKPRRDEFLAAADAEAGDRPFVRTAYHRYDEGLLDADHPTRREMAARRVDRLVLAHLGPTLTLPTSV